MLSSYKGKTYYEVMLMYNHQLDTFLMVADLGSFGKAADAL